ncbi:Retinal guanylyl cyclase 1, partial [Taenia solium]
VASETYDEVPIYISYIVEFTTISAIYTPLQVVDLLNDLCTLSDRTVALYDVYKVGVIKDTLVHPWIQVRPLNSSHSIINRSTLLLFWTLRKRKCELIGVYICLTSLRWKESHLQTAQNRTEALKMHTIRHQTSTWWLRGYQSVMVATMALDLLSACGTRPPNTYHIGVHSSWLDVYLASSPSPSMRAGCK